MSHANNGSGNYYSNHGHHGGYTNGSYSNTENISHMNAGYMSHANNGSGNHYSLQCTPKNCGSRGRDQCSQGFQCKNSKCVKSSKSCMTDSSCGHGEECSWFHCKLKERKCTNRSNCGNHQNCVTEKGWFSTSHLCQYSDDNCVTSRHYETVANTFANNEESVSLQSYSNHGHHGGYSNSSYSNTGYNSHGNHGNYGNHGGYGNHGSGNHYSLQCTPKNCGSRGRDQCSQGFQCKNSKCVKSSKSCMTDSSCGHGEECSWFHCKLKERKCTNRSNCGNHQNCVTEKGWFSTSHLCQYSDDNCVTSRHYETVANTFANNEEFLSLLEGDDYEEAGYSFSDILLAGVFGVSTGILGSYYMNRESYEKQTLM